MNILELIKNADVVVQFTMLFLFILSIFSWTIIFDKILKFSILDARTWRFMSVIKKKHDLDSILDIANKKNNHPFAKIFTSMVNEVKSADNSAYNSKLLKELAIGSAKIVESESIVRLESGLIWLAIIGSVAPFIGLFGTVWGIMNSFQSIALSNNVSLSVVAPGIAEALLATALGLICAIPAVIAYNIFANKVNNFSAKANNFIILVLGRIVTQFIK